MLILTRRVGETVMIGDDVTITVLGVKGNQVRVGINAPKHVAVHREEIYERIKREQHNNRLRRRVREAQDRGVRACLTVAGAAAAPGAEVSRELRSDVRGLCLHHPATLAQLPPDALLGRPRDGEAASQRPSAVARQQLARQGLHFVAPHGARGGLDIGGEQPVVLCKRHREAHERVRARRGAARSSSGARKSMP